MAIEDTKRLFSTDIEQKANKLLAQGWTLLGALPYQHGPDTVTMTYKLAWQADGEPPELPAPDLMTAEF